MRRARVLVVAGLTAVVIALLWSNCGRDSGRDESPPGAVPDAYEQTTTPRSVPRDRSRSMPAAARESGSAPAPASTATLPASDAPLQPVPPRDLTVFVTDEGGAPIVGLWTYVDADQSGQRGQGRTDDHGAVRFRAAAGPRSIDVSEKIVPGRCFLPVGLVRVGETDSEVRIRLREGEAIEGRVFDENGAPVVRVNVSVLETGGFCNQITTDTHGAFRLAVPAGTVCDVRIGYMVPDTPEDDAAKVWWPDESFEGSLERVSAGTTGVVLQGRRIHSDRTLSVVVTDPDGSPMPGVFVAVSLRYLEQGLDTDSSGRCRFEGLPDRVLTVSAWPPNPGPRDIHAQSRRISVLPNGQEIVVELRRAHLIKVSLVDATGAAVRGAGVIVRATGPNREGTTAKSDADGRLVLRIPADTPGLWHVATTPGASPRGEAVVTVPTDTELRLVVEPR